VRLGRRYLGSFDVPFQTILANKRIEGTFEVEVPLPILGYELEPPERVWQLRVERLALDAWGWGEGMQPQRGPRGCNRSGGSGRGGGSGGVGVVVVGGGGYAAAAAAPRTWLRRLSQVE
jgi:hypothetical protein